MITEYLSHLLSNGGVVMLPVALAAGVIAGLNPCCLPIYPAAVGCCAACKSDTIRGNLAIAGALVLGTTITTTILGIATVFAGRIFSGLGSWPVYLMAAVLIAFGLHLLVFIPVPVETKLRWKPKGSVGAMGIGALLGLVHTPCTTPILVGLLSYAAVTGDPGWGGLLLFTYGLGLGIPILLLGTTAASLVSRLSTEKARRTAEYISGVIMIGVGLYLLWIA